MKFTIKTRPLAIKLAMYAVFAYLVLASLSSLGIFTLSGIERPFLLTIVGLFILLDQGVYAKRKLHQPRGFINWALTLAAVILLVSVLFGFMSISLSGFLGTLQGLTTSFLAIILLVTLLTD